MGVQSKLDNVQLINYTQKNLCTILPTHFAVNTLHAGKCVHKPT